MVFCQAILSKTAVRHIIYGFLPSHIWSTNEKLIVSVVGQLFSSKYQNALPKSHIFISVRSTLTLNSSGFAPKWNASVFYCAHFFRYHHFESNIYVEKKTTQPNEQKLETPDSAWLQLLFLWLAVSEISSTAFFGHIFCASVLLIFFCCVCIFCTVMVNLECIFFALTQLQIEEIKEKSLLTLWIGTSNDIFQKCVLRCN